MKERIQQLKIDFEKLETVSEIFNGLHPTIIWFSDTESKYETSFVNFEEKVIWLNGAWYAFQEQQKKIDDVFNLVCKLQYSSGDRIYSEVKELLK